MAQTHRTRSARRHEQGTSYIELLAVLLVTGILTAVSGLGLQRLTNPLDNHALELSGLLMSARAQAVASTGAVRVNVSAQGVTAETARTCADANSAWTPVRNIDMTLTGGVRAVLPSPAPGVAPPTQTLICFDSRGQTAAHTSIVLERLGKRRTVEVMLAGSVRVRS